MTFWDLLPASDERTLVIGKTGSGKSYMLRALLARAPFTLVHDAKGLLRIKPNPRKPKERYWKGFERFTSLARLIRAGDEPRKHPKLIYAPNRRELRNEELQNAFFEYAYLRGNTLVGVDEVGALVRGQIYPDAYHDCLTRGREKNVSVVSATQRPVGVPQTLFSETDLFFIFTLQAEQDRDKVASIVPLDPDALHPENLPDRKFYYYNVRARAVTGPHELS